MSASDAVVVSTRVAVDRATAFAVFTEEIGAWWRPGPRFRFAGSGDGRLTLEPGVGGRLLDASRDGKGSPAEVARVVLWEPPSRIVLDWGLSEPKAKARTEVEVRFDAEGGETRVTVTHRGWDRVPRGHPSRQGFSGREHANLVGLRWADLLSEMRHAAESRSETGPP